MIPGSVSRRAKSKMEPASHASLQSGYCKDCGAAVNSRHCGACGQAFPTHRLSFGHIAREIPHAIFHLDRGVLPTLLGLALRPGVTINAYLNGRRKRLSNPLTLLLIMAGFSVLVDAFFSPADTVAASVATENAKTVWHLFSEYLLVMLALQLPLTALITRVILRSGGRIYGEHLAAHTYIFAFTCLIAAALSAIRWGLEISQYVIAFYASNSAYQIWAMYSVFAPTARHRGILLLKTTSAFVLYSALNTATLWAVVNIYGAA